jgi:hypothetical protein
MMKGTATNEGPPILLCFDGSRPLFRISPEVESLYFDRGPRTANAHLPFVFSAMYSGQSYSLVERD